MDKTRRYGDPQGGKILFNLGDASYIDSSGLGNLVSAFASVQKQKGELKLLNLTKNVHDMMQITKPYAVFDIMEDEEVVVRSFAQPLAAPPDFGSDCTRPDFIGSGIPRPSK